MYVFKKGNDIIAKLGCDLQYQAISVPEMFKVKKGLGQSPSMIKTRM